MLLALDAAAIHRWSGVCVDLLDERRAELDRINVFPVADSDTGTNLLITARAAADALARRLAEGAGVDPAGAAAALASGALRGARGNSGVIISQLYRALAEVLADRAPKGLTGPALADALCRADSLARAAVSHPVEGTVLTVLAAAAAAVPTAAVPTGAGSTGAGSTGAALAAEGDAASPEEPALSDVASAAVRAARQALADTPRRLPALARAGVVDAGGCGLTLLLEALRAVACEAPVADVFADAVAVAALGVGRVRGRDRDWLVGEREVGSAEFEYEVMFLLTDSAPDRVERLRDRLEELGDSVAVVGSGDLGGVAPVWNVHVHCTDVGAAVEAGVDAGRPRRITVVRFADQVGGSDTDRFPHQRAVVVVAGSREVADLVAAERVSVLVSAPEEPLDAARLAAAVAGTRARHVVVLPNDPELTPVAEEAAELAWEAGQETVVVPTSSMLQGMAALAVHDPARRPGDDVVAMAEAAAATRTGALEVAETEALTWVGRCQAGDVLGLVDGEVVLIEHDLVLGARLLVEWMLHSGGELVTVMLGSDAPEGMGEMLESHLRRAHPEVDVVVYSGGPAGRPVALGVE